MPRTACVEDLTFLCVWVCMFFLAEHDETKIRLAFRLDDKQHTAMAGVVPGTIIQDDHIAITDDEPKKTIH
jgi:hypothetical protein